MNRYKYILLAAFASIIVSCNDKYICHDDHNPIPTPNTSVTVEYDWSRTDSCENKDCNLSIVGKEGDNKGNVQTSSNGCALEVEEGEYSLFAYEDADNIICDKYIIRVDKLNNGCLCQPSAFSAGEGVLTVEGGKANVSTVQMIRQTRELIVKIRVHANATHLVRQDKLEGNLNGVTCSRDILSGFPPQECTHRELAPSEYGILEMQYAKEEGVDMRTDEFPLVFKSQSRLIGIGTEVTNSLTVRNLSINNGSSHFTFDASEALEEFHTLEEIAEPYVIVIDITLNENTVTGEVTVEIIDWAFGSEHYIIIQE